MLQKWLFKTNFMQIVQLVTVIFVCDFIQILHLVTVIFVRDFK